ncbi:MAG: SIR2 family protein [Flexilinea sp.]|nr:SIR2 family protein [Flexilinea sp.]
MNNLSNPQVLFLGNGLNLAFGGISWSDLIEKISKRDDFDWAGSEMPMPLQAILASNNQIRTSLQAAKEDFRGKIQTEQQMEVLRVLLTMGFDDIITTNYSYELEEAALGKFELSDRQIAKLMGYTSDHAERNYLLHTYNRVQCENIENRIWHIHGEIRKTDSMILGHYWYGKLLYKIIEESEKRKDLYARSQKEEKPAELNSWMDSFILGDVYILGFGFGLSEVDLWWLLNRKQRERAEHGKVYFYELRSEKQREKTELLKLMDVEVIDLGFSQTEKTKTDGKPDYETFYRAAIEDVRQKITQKPSD